MEIYKIEKDWKDLFAIVYDDPIGTKDRIRIKVCYNPNQEGAFLFALKKFWDNYERLKTNQRLNE
jgi:hypothetical protein